MEEDGPDFGYAFGSQPNTPLWHPAARPDTPGLAQVPAQPPIDILQQAAADVRHHNEQAFAQNGTVTSEKGAAPATSSTDAYESHARLQTDTSNARDSTIQPHDSAEASENMQTQLQEAEAPQAIAEVLATGPAVEGSETEQVSLIPDTREDARPLERALSYEPLYPDSTAESMSQTVEPPSDTHAPDELYEPQSESTFLDEAIQERPSAPLIADEATEMDWGQTADDFGLSAPIEPAQGARVPDTIAVEPRGDVTEVAMDIVREDKDVELDWDKSMQDEPVFRSELEVVSKEQGFEMEWPGGAADDFDIEQSNAPEEALKTKDSDMSAWEAAFGDDDLLADDSSKPSTGPAFFEDDGEGFLDETSATAASEPVPTSVSSAPGASKYSPATSSAPQQAQNNLYQPQGPQFTDFSQLSRAANTPQTSLGGYQQVSAYGTARPQIKPVGDGRSFSDKAKTGYASPYDLPEDLSKSSRRRPQGAGISRQAQPTPPAPPPRTSSYGFPHPGDLSRTQTNTSTGALTQSRPPSSGSAYQPSQGPQSGKTSLDKVVKAPLASASGFFEDLPVTQRPKREPSGRYTPAQTPQPQQSPAFPPGPPQQMQMPSQQVQVQHHSQGQQPTPPQSSFGQFRPPDRPAMFPDQPTVPAPGPPKVVAPTSNRYSPAPGSAPAGGLVAPPNVAPRYSPAPPPQTTSAPSADRYTSTQGPPGPPVKPFVPRHSSPLARFTSASSQEDTAPATSKPLPQQPGLDYQPQQQQMESATYGQEAVPWQNGYNVTPPNGLKSTITPPPPGQVPPAASPRKRSTYMPSAQLPLVPETTVVPPMRSQSGSPGSRMRNSKLAITPIDRPASAFDLPSPKRANASIASTFSLPHRRGFSHELNFIPPQNESAQDSLQRWKGCPIFTWGPAGHVVSVFPMHIPRYGGGQSAPMIKASPGEPKLRTIKDVIGADEILSGFPGPLKKNKKKEVVTWLKSTISTLEKQAQMTAYQQSMPQDAKRTEEKLILWKTMAILVENDGVLEGTPAVHDVVRAVLTSEDSAPPPIGLAASEPSNALGLQRGLSSEAVSPDIVRSIREHLSKGDREKAAWLAVDERLWGHAMLISSTLSKDVWRQVIQEFVRKEVKSAGSGNESLAALYEVFAGNWEESIDQLVPASTRSGFQMISTIDPTAANKDALAGLDKWRETLLLILSNRSADDTQALLSLGKLLAEYGRIEAAHTCYLFARQSVIFSGADDPQANMTLVGADPRFQVDFGKDIESILLSEVYEFALSLSASTPATVPHLQAYKLYHALALAEAGLRDEARTYTDHIASLVMSKTKLSTYYNPYLLNMLDDLNKRLNQTPSSSTGIFSKPTMNKMGSSLFTKFNSFVAGDDKENASNDSGQQENGPFARISGDTPPTISRTTSLQDIYGTYANGGPVGGLQSAGRYGPGAASNTYAPRSSLEQARPQQFNQYAPQSARTSLDSVRPGEAAHSPAVSEYNPYGNAPSQHPLQQSQSTSSFSPPQQRSYAPQLPRSVSYAGTPGGNGSLAASYTPPANVYTPSPYAVTPEPEGAAPHPYQPRQPEPQLQSNDSFGYEPQAPVEPEAAGYQPLPAEPQHVPPHPASYEPTPQASFDDQPSGYAPPTSGHEAPSYQPYEPDAETTAEEADGEAPKPKKSFMDDDDEDDLVKRAAALKLGNKAKADRDADEAFRKAAEADAKRDATAASQKSGWFSGLWGKKDPSIPQTGPIKAKLGEESSFVYDPELKRWVDKKNPQAATTATATPPPPKGPMGGVRAASGTTPPTSAGLGAPPPGGSRATSGPPSMPPRMGSAMGMAGPAVQPTGSASGPPSRVGTPGSVAGDGPAGGMMPPAGLPTSSGGPPSRPTTSMSNASSIEDLIGPAAGRKGPSKKKGRGGRYIDVMANHGS